MDIPQSLPQITKSNSLALPNISKTHAKIATYRTTRATTTSRHQSVFLQKIKDISATSPYPQLQTAKISQQQQNLKLLLREFNTETYQILNRYIDRPVSKKRKSNSTSSSIMEVKEKQLTNSNNMLEICRKEMEILEKQCQNLKFLTVEDFATKIDSLRKEIDELRVKNRQIQKSNVLRGLAIKRGDDKGVHQVAEMEQEKLILDKKRQRLLEENKGVSDQQDKFNQNMGKVDEELVRVGLEVAKYDQESKEEREYQELVKLYNQKKKYYQSKKTKTPNPSQPSQTQPSTSASTPTPKNPLKPVAVSIPSPPTPLPTAITTNKHQYQYLKLLKQLDQITKRSKLHDQSLNDVIERVQNSRMELVDLEGRLRVKSGGDKKGIVVNQGAPNDKNDRQAKQQNSKVEQQQKKEQKKWYIF